MFSFLLILKDIVILYIQETFIKRNTNYEFRFHIDLQINEHVFSFSIMPVYKYCRRELLFFSYLYFMLKKYQAFFFPLTKISKIN